ncbi:MAG TPA: ATP-dependent DNA ligase [Paracoccaceae bacterium]|nr:ATP-dependent DNA ligase [Paracoccaceae bacterium]
MPDTIPLDLRPMEAEPADALPSGGDWQFEPKYDGFRCLAHWRPKGVRLQSKNGKPLERYFPELAAGLGALPETGFVLDGEIVIPGGSFETLQLRLHPAASRVAKLSRESPAQFVAFDLPARGGEDLTGRPFAERRAALEAFVRAAPRTPSLRLGKATRSAATARRWLGAEGLDGIIAKRLDLAYQPGKRAMQKFKEWKTIDCVIGGLYRRRGSEAIEYLLLGLYDEDGRLNYVGRARAGDAAEMKRKVEPLTGGQGFTGRAPGGKSRWSGREREPVPLEPRLVAEVSADHITGEHMRHGARLLRWRPDKDPEACTMDQIRAG